jgi:hypothetical protein
MAGYSHGPVDLVLVEMSGEVSPPAIAGAFADLMASDVLRLLDLVLVSRDDAGEVVVVELEEFENGDVALDIIIEEPGLVTEEDINELTSDLGSGKSALLFAIEHVWARDLSELLENAGGVVMTETRIPAHAVSAALGE